MNPDNNWKETRLLSQDLSELLGVPVQATEDFLLVMENLIIHKFIETISDEDFRGKDCQIELPYLGSLVISVDDKDRMSINFVVRKSFYKKIKNAYNNKNNPLSDQLCKILGYKLSQIIEEEK